MKLTRTIQNCIGCLAIVALVATACADPDASPASASVSVSQTEVLDLESKLATATTPENAALINNAQHEIAEACMQALGWDLEFGRETAEQIEDLISAVMTPAESWMFDNLAEAAANGYGIESFIANKSSPNTSVAASGASEVEEMSPADQARYQTDLFGSENERIEIVTLDGGEMSVPGGGCFGEAQRAIWGDVPAYYRLRDLSGQAESEAWQLTIDSPAVEAALASWSSCMKKHGHDLADPTASLDLASQVGNEDALAPVDVACKTDSELPAAFGTEFKLAADYVLSDYASGLEEYRGLEAAATARARTYVGDN